MQVAPQDYQNVPIDIQTSKLMDWLQDRRHCGRRWQAQVQQVRERIQAALQDMPEHPEIRELLQGSFLHYFHCLRIVEILKGTEASTKNLFGRYSSQRMKDWQEIVSLYEKENAYLAELCSLLSRSVSYEAPALRRQLARGLQAQQELARREDECQVRASELRERYLGSCRQYGIAIDWGDFPEEPPRGGDIDWGITVEPSPQGDDGIDWGDGEKGTVTAEPSPQGDDGIDWGDGEKGTITAEPSPQGDDGIDWGDGGGQEGTITVLEAGTEAPEDVARGSDALTLLENAETRNQFLDELMELELFLAQRLLEMEDEADVVAMSQLQLAPAVLQGQSSERLRAQLATVRELLAQLCSPSVQHLCMILASPRYVERVSALLRQKLLQAELLVAKRDALAQQRRRALAEQAALEPKLQQLQDSTKELQKLIEADISKRYGGRPVNLMGINV
ncbi:CDK5 regulatory subunit-associated protein 3 isoform X4 [Catharus ustulatus]|uniref:CDK5 regulatory subunit-associated protein 3 isoform X4 n=1 Tax=Catharus ustulatus TaxID=91951 RepID=UPI001407D5D3|nr:CDK5 regulatory subunit-associated protein 3 isoform X4 [Catharus ustulatus]